VTIADGVSREPSETAARPSPRSSRPRILIFAAEVGGGHQAAGKALLSRLHQAGYDGVVIDGLHLLSPALDWMMRPGYTAQLVYAPDSLDLVFQVFTNRLTAPVVRRTLGGLFGHRLLHEINRYQPDLIVTAFPMTTSALGELLRDGRLRVPVVAIVSDFGVHRLWTHPVIPLHLLPSHASAEIARGFGVKAVAVKFPTGPRFHDLPSREAARRELGIPEDCFVTLITGGTWGVGNLAKTAELCLMAARTAVIPVKTIIVCGKNALLEDHLSDRFGAEPRVSVLGWTSKLPLLMRASDCLIQNAGGMTCLEAIETNLPIIFHNPIPGHGAWNAEVMVKAGAAYWPGSDDNLTRLLEGAIRGDQPLKRPAAAPDLLDPIPLIRKMLDE